MIGVYFSGTGNTKHCVEEFVKHFDGDNEVISIEAPNITEVLKKHEFIILGYPIYFSNTPKIMKDFIINNKNHFKNKRIFIIATMGLFSGDGAGCSARVLKKYGAEIVGGLHLKMPDCIGDENLLKRPLADNKEIIKQADKKITVSVEKLKNGTPSQDGLNIFYHIAGLFGQRLWFYGKTTTYKEKPNVDTNKCIGCGRCTDLCPMNNIKIINNKAVSGNKCTMCYRCFSHCPPKALTILGKEVHEQCRYESYQ